MQFSIDRNKKGLPAGRQGFTIIEVMIVLAIAALILLVVFLAVPALQRSQRNNARKSDASRLAAAIVDYTSTSQGVLPTTCANMDTIYNSAATLSQFTGMSCGAVGPLPTTEAGQTDKRYYLATAGSDYTAPTPLAAYKSILLLGEAVRCNGSSALQTSGATSTSMGLLYTLESGSIYSWACVNPQ